MSTPSGEVQQNARLAPSNARRYDIIVCGGVRQFSDLCSLLPRVKPFGTVHLASSFLHDRQLARLEPHFDVLHEPLHHPDGYVNFKLFCCRDINRIVTAPYFIKLDTDVRLSPDWIDYVEECLNERPDAVLFGTHAGSRLLDYRISGSLVDRALGGSARIRHRTKVNGSFYVGQRDFFRENDRRMQRLHDLIYAFVDGRRIRPSHLDEHDSEEQLAAPLVRFRGRYARQGTCSEDNLRSMVVHLAGAQAKSFIWEAAGRVQVPDKLDPPSLSKRAKNRLRQWRAHLPGRPG